MLQCDCHDWIGQKPLCKHVHQVCPKGEDVAGQLAALQATTNDELPPPADVPPLLPSARHPRNNISPEYLIEKTKELAELVPRLPADILDKYANCLCQMEQLVALATIRPPETPPQPWHTVRHSKAALEPCPVCMCVPRPCSRVCQSVG